MPGGGLVRRGAKRAMAGSLLPEVLLAMLLMGLAVGAGLGLVLEGLRGLAEARQRDTAAALASDLAGMIRALPTVDWPAVAPGVPCAAPCAPEALAAAELAAWQARVATALPEGAGEIRPASAGAVAVAVTWTPPHSDAAEVVLGVLP